MLILSTYIPALVFQTPVRRYGWTPKKPYPKFRMQTYYPKNLWTHLRGEWSCITQGCFWLLKIGTRVRVRILRVQGLQEIQRKKRAFDSSRFFIAFMVHAANRWFERCRSPHISGLIDPPTFGLLNGDDNWNFHPEFIGHVQMWEFKPIANHWCQLPTWAPSRSLIRRVSLFVGNPKKWGKTTHPGSI